MSKKMFFSPIGNGLDIDAEAFLLATSITDNTISNAINNLVISLKIDGIWTKSKALYPFVGGTAFTHKFNLKNPLDTDGAFRIVFNGGWTHSSYGAQPNGTNAYADTKFNPFTHLTVGNSCLGLYSNTNSLISSNIDMGAMDLNANTTLFAITLPRNSGYSYYLNTGQTNLGDYALATGFTSSLGFFVGSRISTTPIDCKLFHNGTLKANSTTNTGSYAMPNLNIFIGDLNNFYGSHFYSEKRYAFAIIASGLTDAEVSNLHTAVQTFQTALGRQV